MVRTALRCRMVGFTAMRLNTDMHVNRRRRLPVGNSTDREGRDAGPGQNLCESGHFWVPWIVGCSIRSPTSPAARIHRYALCMPMATGVRLSPSAGSRRSIPEDGIISPGESGDINCGMRFDPHGPDAVEVQPKLRIARTDRLFRIPGGVGSRGFVNLNRRDFREVMRKGAGWCIAKGYGWEGIWIASRNAAASTAPTDARHGLCD